MLHRGLAFKGFSIEATDGKIGVVSDFLFDDASWKLRWLVVNAGTWLTDRKLLIHPSSIDRADVPMQALLLQLTRDQIEKSPSISTDEPVSKQLEYSLYGYYGTDPLWGGGYYGSNAIAMPLMAPSLHNGLMTEAALQLQAEGDPHLQSLAELTSYRIHATDGDIGHLDSFLIDDADWTIRYLVADTRNWWFGRHVLLSPTSVLGFDWAERTLRLNLTCYKIKGSPPWEATGLLDRTYEQMLRAYYEWPALAQHQEPPAAGARDPIPPVT